MSAPVKQWENSRVPDLQSTQNVFADNISTHHLPTERSSVQRTPPPIPSRNTFVNRPNFMTGYSSGLGYSAYGTGYPGYLSGYSPYNTYAGGLYGRFGMNQFGSTGFGEDNPSGFVQQAELSSRQAFQSIESVVQAVVSVAAMLESTFQAVYSSFRAVISVADHMSRLRSYFTRIVSALAVLRTLRWLISKLLVMLRLCQPSNTDEQLWSESGSDIAANPDDVLDTRRMNWPVVLFFMITIGGPWLLWKFLSSLVREESSGWASGVHDHFVAVAEYDFAAQSSDELTFKQGTVLTVAPKELQPHIRGWLLASVDGQKTGIVPANYVRVLGKRRGTKHLESHPAKLSDQLSSTSNRMQQASTVSADNDWSFDDENC